MWSNKHCNFQRFIPLRPGATHINANANKAGYNGYISPDDFNLFFPQAEILYYNKLYDLYYKTQRISDSLSKFLSDSTVIAVNGSGQYIFPTDMFHVDSITHTYTDGKQYPVARVEKDRLANWLSSQIQAPTAQFTIYTEYKTILQFYPITLTAANLIYLKQPTTTVWAYTISGITSLNTLVGGSSYTTGSYLARALTGGTGTGATANFTIAAGAVTAVTIVNPGSNYVAGDTLSVNNANVGGTGTGFSIKVATVAINRPVYNPTASVAPIWSDTDINNIVQIALTDPAINMRDQLLQQYAQTEIATAK